MKSRNSNFQIRKTFVVCMLVLVVLLSLLLSACVLSRRGPAGADEKASDAGLTLEVALYSYVPEPDAARQAVRDAWAREHPDVGLHFTDWDCYATDPGPELDVFVYDAIYLSSFVEEGYLLPIPEEKIRNREDMIPFALEGCRSDGTLYALPQLLCADFLYTRKDDRELSSVSDLPALYDILGDRKNQSVIPEENEGLLINLSDMPLTKVLIYLDALMDQRQAYTAYSRLPSISDLSAPLLERVNDIWKMGGNEQVSYLPEDYDKYVRARWFAEGRGRAYIGYAEAMNAMGDYADDVIMRLFSYGGGRNIPLFYADVVGIRSDISEEKKELAYELANLLISEEVLTKMSLPGEKGGPPQYLLTPRRSVYDTLGGDYPIYSRLKDMLDSPDNHVFRLCAGARAFIAGMGAALDEAPAQAAGF